MYYREIVEKMNYRELLDRTSEYLKNSQISVEHEITDRKEMIAQLNRVFGSYWDKEVELSDMRLRQGGEYEFLDYTSKKKDSTRNYVIVKNGRPLFKYEHTECNTHGFWGSYAEVKKSLYMEGTRRIENRVTEKTWGNNDVEVTDITILNYKGSSYSRHNYTLYTTRVGIISFKNHDQIWIQGENTFDYRLESVIDTITKAKDKINDGVNCIFGGVCVKQYNIKRKNNR